MLNITRKIGEKIIIGEDVVLEVMEVSGSSVRIGIRAPRSVPVYREEIWEAVRAENAAAAIEQLEEAGEIVYTIGKIRAQVGDEHQTVVI